MDSVKWMLAGLVLIGFFLLRKELLSSNETKPDRTISLLTSDEHPKRPISKRNKQFLLDLELVRPGQTVSYLRSRQLLFGLFAMQTGLLVWVLTLKLWWMLTAFPFTAIAYIWPERKIREDARRLREEWQQALPLLLILVLQRMLAGIPPFQAIVQSRERIAPSLRREMDRLITDLQLSGNVLEAWQRWSERIGSTQARRFAALLQHMMTTNSVDPERQLRAAYVTLRREQQEVWRREVRKLPGRLQWSNLILFANMIMLPVIGVGIELSQNFHIFKL